MPDKHERYNRFMKYLAPGYSNEVGSLEDRWSTYKSRCDVCGAEELRTQMKLKGGMLRCQNCLECMNMSET